MKKAPPDEGGAQNLIIETVSPRYWVRPAHFQVFLNRYAAAAFAITFFAATIFVAYVDRQIALRQIGRST